MSRNQPPKLTEICCSLKYCSSQASLSRQVFHSKTIDCKCVWRTSFLCVSRCLKWKLRDLDLVSSLLWPAGLTYPGQFLEPTSAASSEQAENTNPSPRGLGWGSKCPQQQCGKRALDSADNSSLGSFPTASEQRLSFPYLLLNSAQFRLWPKYDL